MIVLKGRMAVVNHVLENVIPRIKYEGYCDLRPGPMWGHWVLEIDGLKISLYGINYVSSEGQEKVVVLDIWPDGERKVFSIRWTAGQSPSVRDLTSFRPGEWLKAFGVVYQPMRGAKRLQLH